MYISIPRNDLTARGVSAEDYVGGPLEDWTRGALNLEGSDQYCVLPHEELVADFTYERRGEKRTYPGEKRIAVDMDTNSFLIEAYLKVPAGGSGELVSKAGEDGYVLEVDEEGRPCMALLADGSECRRAGAVSIADGKWHHLLAEVDRKSEQGIAIYVDGRQQNGPWSGQMPAAGVSLSNEADFLVGRNLPVTLDFLRVSRGTLADAETTIEELYAWQFDGPFLRDFAGRAPAGGRRDAGALEALPPDR
jgi:hypothetical protein